MPFSAGDKLGPYEILAPIGKGGMGEVWKAHDPRLRRDVAIKISVQQFSERFEREAHAIAALNHVNICQVYDVGPNYLVMEFIEGESPKGPLPLDETLRIARQIAEALEAAHEKGITHRDLKPSNIKIKPDGTVKILDFGLAKVSRAAGASGENSPTLTIGMTEAGMILGTAAYMAPEQARGKENVDKRADIWAFGVVLYELLTGKRPFEGEDVGEILAKVIRDEPDLSSVPMQARSLLKRCLEKDPKKRLRDIGDVWLLLADPQAESAPVSSTTMSRFSKLPWIASSGVLAAIALSVSFMHFRETPPPEQMLRSSITLPENSTIHSFAISPDGRTLVIAAAVNGKRQLWLRPMDAVQAQPMAFTEDATYPFWAPNSRTIAFFAQGKLKKVAASGGPAQSLCNAPLGRGGSWNRDDVIVFSPNDEAISIQRVSAAGGVPVDVMKTKGDQRLPVFLPDGRHFLYLLRGGTTETNGVYVGSLDGQENKRVLAADSSVIFTPPARGDRRGHILFVRESTLMAQPFDADGRQVLGNVFPVADDVSIIGYGDSTAATVSENGVLLYETRDVSAGQISWYDRTGKFLGPVGAPGGVLEPAISPDEKLVVYRRRTRAGADLWLRDLSRGTETRFTNDASNNGSPFWSPQGDRIVFRSNRSGGVFNLYQKASSGSRQDEPLLPNRVADVPTQWSRDGRFIVYYEIDPQNKNDLWVLPTEYPAGDRKPIPFLRTGFTEYLAQLSPDSHWMAFTSDQSGRREIYIRPFPPREGEWTISISGGEQPRWRGDGKELFFVAPDGKMMAVPVKTSAGTKPLIEAGAPVALFDAHTPILTAMFQYDVTADGKRFLIAAYDPGSASTPLTMVTNWDTVVKK